MGTTARIAVQLSDCTIKVVALQMDGSPDNVSPILQRFYSTQSDAELLVSGGSIYSLGELYEPVLSIHDNHSFDTPAKNVTVLYGRDRGDDVRYKLYESVGSYIADVMSDDIFNYDYLYINGKWKLIKIQNLHL